ncbi:hypothetical protein M9Y10_017412 [Tritrichomonas musculus]|uniref:Uncharacterized protein n=1 Tax=Tritrichomonas musculus TaxID=1915356 RepID=A0ABR2HTN6_9EUKA
MDEIILKRSEQDYYVPTDEEDTTDTEEPNKATVASHRIEKGQITFVIKQAESDSTQTLSSDDAELPLYANIITSYIKQKAQKSIEKNKLKNELKYIKGCKIIKNETKYVAVFVDGHEESLSSFEMKQNYPSEFLIFLENQIFSNRD